MLPFNRLEASGGEKINYSHLVSKKNNRFHLVSNENNRFHLNLNKNNCSPFSFKEK